MPIYEYYCSDCENRFEKLVSISRINEQPLCPQCGGAKTNKLLSTFAAVRSSGSDASAFSSARSSGGGCAGCSGGSCASCH